MKKETFKIEPIRKFVLTLDVFLHDDYDDGYGKNTGANKNNSVAYFLPGDLFNNTTIGEIHFLRDKVSVGAVFHELLHGYTFLLHGIKNPLELAYPICSKVEEALVLEYSYLLNRVLDWLNSL